ncbi:MAG: hypothetical protein MJZ67_02530 [Bacteroidales bacterium]|nr:hypothetical protein [Bacteroidales bacterium]
MGKIVGTSPSSINGSVGPYTYRQTSNAAVIGAWSGAEALEKAAVSYGGYKAARFLEPGQTSANVAVEGGNDVQTGAVFSGSLRVVSGSNMTAFA